MTTAPFIWYRQNGSTDLINLERDGDQTIVMDSIGESEEYRKHRTKWGNYLLPADWNLRLLNKQWSGNLDYRDVYDIMVMGLSSQAEADGVKLIGHNVDRIDNDPETMTSTYLAEAIGYVK